MLESQRKIELGICRTVHYPGDDSRGCNQKWGTQKEGVCLDLKQCMPSLTQYPSTYALWQCHMIRSGICAAHIWARQRRGAVLAKDMGNSCLTVLVAPWPEILGQINGRYICASTYRHLCRVMSAQSYAILHWRCPHRKLQYSWKHFYTFLMCGAKPNWISVDWISVDTCTCHCPDCFWYL